MRRAPARSFPPARAGGPPTAPRRSGRLPAAGRHGAPAAREAHSRARGRRPASGRRRVPASALAAGRPSADATRHAGVCKRTDLPACNQQQAARYRLGAGSGRPLSSRGQPPGRHPCPAAAPSPSSPSPASLPHSRVPPSAPGSRLAPGRCSSESRRTSFRSPARSSSRLGRPGIHRRGEERAPVHPPGRAAADDRAAREPGLRLARRGARRARRRRPGRRRCRVGGAATPLEARAVGRTGAAGGSGRAVPTLSLKGVNRRVDERRVTIVALDPSRSR